MRLPLLFLIGCVMFLSDVSIAPASFYGSGSLFGGVGFYIYFIFSWLFGTFLVICSTYVVFGERVRKMWKKAIRSAFLLGFPIITAGEIITVSLTGVRTNYILLNPLRVLNDSIALSCVSLAILYELPRQLLHVYMCTVWSRLALPPSGLIKSLTKGSALDKIRRGMLISAIGVLFTYFIFEGYLKGGVLNLHVFPGDLKTWRIFLLAGDHVEVSMLATASVDFCVTNLGEVVFGPAIARGERNIFNFTTNRSGFYYFNFKNGLGFELGSGVLLDFEISRTTTNSLLAIGLTLLAIGLLLQTIHILRKSSLRRGSKGQIFSI